MQQLTKTLLHVINSKQIDYACFRDKTSLNFEELAAQFLHIVKNSSIKKSFLNSDYKLAHKLGFDGVHLTSSQFEKIEDALQLGLHVVVSTHSINEIKKLSQHNIFAFTFSPIFATPNKGKPKGISELQKAITCSDKKIVALGGIVDNTHIDLIRKTNAFGFASIRYFL